MVPSDIFNNLTTTYILIYNPRWERGRPARVFLELPAGDRRYYVEMSSTHAAIFVGKVKEIVDKT